MNKLKHRLWLHRPLSPFRLMYPALAEYMFGPVIPRCTFRELGKDCPIIRQSEELQ